MQLQLGSYQRGFQIIALSFTYQSFSKQQQEQILRNVSLLYPIFGEIKPILITIDRTLLNHVLKVRPRLASRLISKRFLLQVLLKEVSHSLMVGVPGCSRLKIHKLLRGGCSFHSQNKSLIRLHRFLSYIPEHDLIQQSQERNNLSFLNKMSLRWMSKDFCFPSCRSVVFRAISSNTLFPWVSGRSHACFQGRGEKCPRSFPNDQDRFFHESKQKVIVDCSMLICLILEVARGEREMGEGGSRPLRVGGMCLISSRGFHQCRGFIPHLCFSCLLKRLTFIYASVPKSPYKVVFAIPQGMANDRCIMFVESQLYLHFFL